MQHRLYVILVFLHITGAMLWVGGMLFMSLMLIPSLRQKGDPRLTAELLRAVGARFHRWGWGALGFLLISGLVLLHLRGIPPRLFVSGDFWRSTFGTTLAWKLGGFTLIVGLSLGHDLHAARRRGQSQTDPAAAARARRIASWLGRIVLALSLGMVLLGVMLVRGNPWA